MKKNSSNVEEDRGGKGRSPFQAFNATLDDLLSKGAQTVKDSVKIEVPDLEDKEGGFSFIDIALIQPDPEQPRKFFDQEELNNLATSIKKNSVLQPILVRQNESNFIIVAGERRWKAANIAGLSKVPVILTKGNPLEISLIENLQRENLNPIDQAEALQRMIKNHQYTQTKLAAVLGKSRIVINEVLALTRLPDEIKDECRNTNKYPTRLLVEIAKQGDPDDLESKRGLWKLVKENNLTSATIREVSRGKKKKEIHLNKTGVTIEKIASMSKYVKKLKLDTMAADEKGRVLIELNALKNTLDEMLK